MNIIKNKNTREAHRKRASNVGDDRTTKFTYHSVRSASELNTGRAPRDPQVEKVNITRTRWWSHTPAYVAALILLALVLYALTLSTSPKVSIVDSSNQNIVQSISTYQAAVQKILASSLLNQTKITIDTDKLSGEIQQQFPDLNAVTIVLPLFGRTPLVEIRPSESILVLANAQGRFVINQQGDAVLMLSPATENSYNLPVVTDDSGLHVKLGEEILPSTSMVFIKTVVDQFTAKDMSIQSMTLSATPYELDVQVRGLPYYIKFDLQTDPLYAVGTYLATIKLFTPSNPGPSQYIDVRIPGRAYYK